MKKILVLNGPNVNMIGKREPELYGTTTMDDINNLIREEAKRLNVEVDFFQSNCIGEMITRIQECLGTVDGIVMNPGGYGHYAYALLDALNAVALPCIEVHISNTHAREEFRHHSVIGGACVGQIIGMGVDGYLFAVQKLAKM
ncbi:type II 3-dehydroquinate dehydratase [Ruminococcaceae bacterium OttesenSCG-928-A16]|nr:type II 3-dehydroquinate dehydratase [Ruminococcaceae bacterium OttesenSCG-928-A16]